MCPPFLVGYVLHYEDVSIVLVDDSEEDLGEALEIRPFPLLTDDLVVIVSILLAYHHALSFLLVLLSALSSSE